MKRRKRDAADELVGIIMGAIRKYHREKDAPEKAKQLSMIAKEDESDGRWRCPHVTHCSHRVACDIAMANPAKDPLKEDKTA